MTAESWNSVFNPEGLRRAWDEERNPTIAHLILDSDCNKKGEPTDEGYQRISDELNNLADLMSGGKGELTRQLSYALWYTLFSHVEQITDMRRTLNSEEGKNAPGAIRMSAKRAIEELEARYARLVREYQGMPEGLRPDMRDRRLILPEGDA
ncbi:MULTISPECIES: hypothetical protein [Streptomyces]|uniref:hypothetical protein n=1 Tax=Streptomyces TaxID=1883 RepID=UPI0016044962|nr:hypothetical protein [Streptomyces murinus]MBA9050795.1 hypothetical protein [Streptomyces murinus]